MVDISLIADNERDLIKIATVKALNLSKPVYIVKTLDKKFRVTAFSPHSADWKREKFEWSRTVYPVEIPK